MTTNDISTTTTDQLNLNQISVQMGFVIFCVEPVFMFCVILLCWGLS